MSGFSADEIHDENYDRGMDHVEQAIALLNEADKARERLTPEYLLVIVHAANAHANIANALFNAQISPH